MTSELSPDGAPLPSDEAPQAEAAEQVAAVAEESLPAEEAASSEPSVSEATVSEAEEDQRTSPAVPERPWARRTFVLGALGGIGAALAAVVGVPVAGLAAAPAARDPLRLSLLAGSVPPTPRISGFTNLGPLSNFAIGVPTLLPVTVPVDIGGTTQDTQIAVYVVRPHDQSVLILDIHCTHMGCPVGWSQGAKRFLCPCHGGAFTADGVEVAGPPPRPLYRYQSLIANQEVWMGPLIEEA
jgi:menaquinol-cytochrome c reductase iron-sulfur subunit